MNRERDEENKPADLVEEAAEVAIDAFDSGPDVGDLIGSLLSGLFD